MSEVPGTALFGENVDEKIEENKRFFWKSKRVSEKVYKARLTQQGLGRQLRNIYGTKSNLKQDVNKQESTDRDMVAEGRRIVHLKTLGRNLNCGRCKFCISLENIKYEKRRGLASILFIECKRCWHITHVTTDKQHGPNKHFDINTKVVSGILNSGNGHRHLNKLLSSANIPTMPWNTFKDHQKEVGKAVEEMAIDSCKPDRLKENFILPNSSLDEGEENITLEELVRIGCSFDMGWPTAGSRRSYNSYSGTGCFIGLYYKKVLSWVTLNRKCRMCDCGHPKSDHDCRLNFEGSAKAMEPKAASLMVKNNPIFVENNVEVGVFVGDNDSSAIGAARNTVDYEIIKQDDLNHTGKGLTSELYKIIKSHKELNSKSIQYLTRCFHYSVTQNTDDRIAMAKAIKNIPQHCFNNHENCGNWCKARKNPGTYKHSVIGDGFTSQSLYDNLKRIFDNLAFRSDRFSAGVSSNPNESMNAQFASTAPKPRMYGLSASYDYRVACAVNKKNDGEKYILDLNKRLKMSPGKNTKRHCEKVDTHAERRYAKSIEPAFKRRRLALKQEKAELRYKKELGEGPTYEPNMTLLSTLYDNIPVACINEDECIVVFFDTETSGFALTADILSLAAKYNDLEFSIFIKPTQPTKEAASQINGFRCIDGNLLLHGKIVKAVSLLEAMKEFYTFLYSLKEKCILTAHNCHFDYPKLMNAIEKTSMSKYFESVVSGFSDTLSLIRNVTGFKNKSQTKLENLAKHFGIDASNAHDALADVHMMEKVLTKLSIPSEKIIERAITWHDVLQNRILSKEVAEKMKDYDLFSTCLSSEMRKRLIIANITQDMVLKVYSKDGFDGVRRMFGKDENGVVVVTKDKNVVTRLCDFLKSSPNVPAQDM